jgi:hypothetical protein
MNEKDRRRMIEYIVHIGLPKTGTKYLQRSLFQVREKLLEQGIDYPSGLWTDRSHFSHFKIVEHLKAKSTDQLRSFFGELNNAPLSKVVLSCEGFVGLNSEEIGVLKELMNSSKVEIVFYTRRWSDWLPSAWQQSVRQGGRETIPEFVYNLLKNPENEQAINHGQILDRYAAIFGYGSIKLMSYSNVMDARKDIFADFAETVLKWKAPAVQQEVVNESIGQFHVELVRTLNGMDFGAKRDSFLIDRSFTTIARQESIKADMNFVLEGMKKHQRTLVINDDSTALRFLYDQMFSKYKDRLVGVGAGTRLFDKRSRKVSYIAPDYLLEDGAREAVKRIYTAIRESLKG